MAKSRNGEGSIKPRKVAKGTVYDVQLTVRDRRTGLSRRVFKGGFATERKAVEWRNETMRKSAAGGLVREKPITVPEVVDTWMRTMPAKAPTTMARYDAVINHHIRPRLNMRASQLTEHAVRTFMAGTAEAVAGMRGTDGNATNAIALAVLKAAFRWAARPDVGLLPHDPLNGLKRGAVLRPLQRRQALPMVLLGRLLEVSEGKPSQLLWRLLAETGARRGEILGLTWADIDFTACQLTVDKIASPESGGTRTSARTKGHLARTIPLPEDLAQTLKERFTSSGAALSDPVIRPPRSRFHLSFGTMHDWWVRDCRQAGISGYGPHSLRHTWATTALAKGVPVNVVSSILGHSSPAITLEVYGHVLPDQRVAAMDIVSDIIHNRNAK